MEATMAQLAKQNAAKQVQELISNDSRSKPYEQWGKC